MNKVKKYASLLFAVCLLCLAGAAVVLAEDFTFTVPVNLKALDPSIKQVLVACSVDQLHSATASGAMVPDANGNVVQNVVVKFNYPPDPSKATKYTCYLQLSYNGGVCIFGPGSSPQGTQCAMKAPSNGFVTGDLPKQ